MTDYALPRLNQGIYPWLVAAGWMALAVPCSLGQAGAAAAPASSLPSNASYAPTMTFDVASVRESKPDVNSGFRTVDAGGFQPPNSSNLRLENYDLMNLILRAYEVNPHLIEGIPRD